MSLTTERRRVEYDLDISGKAEFFDTLPSAVRLFLLLHWTIAELEAEMAVSVIADVEVNVEVGSEPWNGFTLLSTRTRLESVSVTRLDVVLPLKRFSWPVVDDDERPPEGVINQRRRLSRLLREQLEESERDNCLDILTRDWRFG